MEFWNELLTKASWEKLTYLTKEIKFILIGGWAAYLWTGLHKSKDIDIIVDYDVLFDLKKRYDVRKNNNLKKYEIKFEKFDIDIYAPGFSKLVIPVEDIIKKYHTKIQGINTTTPEVLLILKQGAEIDRRNSIKGKKDSIDILTLLMSAPIDLNKYKKLLVKYGKEGFVRELLIIIRNFDDRDIMYLNKDFVEYKKWRKKIIEGLKKL